MNKVLAILVGMMALTATGLAHAEDGPVTLYHEAEAITVRAPAPTATALYYEAEAITVRGLAPVRNAIYFEAPAIIVTATRAAAKTSALYWEAPAVTVSAKRTSPVRFALAATEEPTRL